MSLLSDSGLFAFWREETGKPQCRAEKNPLAFSFPGTAMGQTLSSIDVPLRPGSVQQRTSLMACTVEFSRMRVMSAFVYEGQLSSISTLCSVDVLYPVFRGSFRLMF